MTRHWRNYLNLTKARAEKINDLQAFKLASDIKDRIEKEMTYPGQIKVNVIREYRAIETAK